MNTSRAFGTSSRPLSFQLSAIVKLAFVALVIAAAFLRLYGLSWDSNQHLHPDERHIVMVTIDRIGLPWPNLQDAHLDEPKRSTLNPRSADPANGQARSFAYGAFPLYLLKATGHVISQWWKPASGYEGLTLVGRGLSALFDLGTVLLIFLIGRRLYGDRAGILAALLLSFTVLHIQLSHFYAVDTLLTFFVFATLYLGLKVMEQPTAGRLVSMGALAGIAMSCKVSAAPVLLPCAVACLAGTYSRRREGESLGDWFTSGITAAALSVLTAVGVFFLFQPYVLLDSQPFIKDIRYESEMVRGIAVPPYTVQYLRTEPVLYHLRNLLLWTAGPALGIVALVGMLPFGFRLLQERRKEEWLLASWLIPYLAITMSFQVKFARYFLPAMPILVLVAAALLASMTRRRPVVAGWRSLALVALPVVVISVTALQAVGFSAIYGEEHTRVRASRWIYDNIPTGAALATEHWDDSLPLRLPDVAGRQANYTNVSLPMYDGETPAKRQEIIKRLTQADYVVISSNRLYASIPRVPEVYPVASAYYGLLFQGALGFERVAEFASYPAIGPIRLVDDAADESFTVYDHPKVIIFKKSAEYSEERVRNLLEAIPLARVATIREVQQASRSQLLLSDEIREVQGEGGTWSQLYQRDSLANRFPTVAWWLAIQLMGLLALPLAWRLFSRFADGGYGLAKVLGILVVAYVAWLGPSLQLIPFGPGAILVGLALLTAASLLSLWGRWGSFRGYVAGRLRTFFLYEMLFVAAFSTFWVIRSLNPDLWHTNFGGEKPMEFAYLNAVAKSTYFPPYDPWLAGGYINYYYFGYVIVAVLMRLTGVIPAVAFNLAIASLFALTAVGLFSFGFNYWAKRQPAHPSGLGLPAVAAGLATSVFVLIATNLDGLVQILESLWKLSSLQAKSTIPGMSGLVGAAGGLWAALSSGRPLPPFDFWRSTRVIGPEEVTPITEFPYFTFLYGDLHPHMISMPLATLALGLALAIVWRHSKTGDGQEGQSLWDRAITIGVAGLVVGALQATNSWDYPTYLLLLSAAFLVGSLLRDRALTWRSVVDAAISAGATYIVATLLFLPFTRAYELFYNGVDPAKGRTSVNHYLLIFGFFLFCIVSALVVDSYHNRWHRQWLRSVWDRIVNPGRAARRRQIASVLVHPSPWVELLPTVVMAALAVAAVAVLFRHFLIAVQVILGVAVLLSLYRRASPPERVLLAIFAGLGLALTLGVELVTIKGDIGRMNTVFKFYLQAWFLLGIAAALGVATVFTGWRGKGPQWLSSWKTAWAAGLAFLFLSVLIYPVAATPVKVGLRFQPMPPTLDGMAYMRSASFKDQNKDVVLARDYAAIRWLQDSVGGSPVVLEAQVPEYRWGSRVSVYTGLPTVLGWTWHQRQQRWAYQWMIDERLRDIKTMFESQDQAQVLGLLRKYGVRLVYVGDLERAYYPPAGLAKFDAMIGSGLAVAYRSEGVTIYEVSYPDQSGVILSNIAPPGRG